MSAAGVTPERFRAGFPIFESKIFLNSCSKGALSESVEEGFRRYLDSWKQDGSPWDDWVGMLERLRSRFAEFCGASAEEIAVTSCASTAVGSLLSALSFEGGRRRVLLGDFEFPTMAHNWLAQAKRGAEIVRIRAEVSREAPGRESLPADSYLTELDEQTLAVPIAHVCFRNGYRQDVARVARAARDAGALTIVDDYQSTGTRPLDVKEMGCDILVTGALKYLLGSSGLAFLYVRKELIEKLEPSLTGWFAQARPFDFDIERATYHPSARRFESGTPAVPSLFAGLAGLEVLAEVGPDAVLSHVESLTSLLIREAEARGYEVWTPREVDRRGALVVLGCRDSARLVEVLARENVVASSRGDGLRISFHYYNLPEDVEALLRILDQHPELLANSPSSQPRR